MDSWHSSYEECYNIVSRLYSHKLCVNYTEYISLLNFCNTVYDSEDEGVYGKPMVWIGIYIAIASLFCILAMAADLLHGFRNRKMWLPCKYFSLNATSITVMTVAMKLPVDLSSLMPGFIDQATKMGSLAFMCTMMANLMPSLASIDNKTLLANFIGLTILIITIIVNICIQINTGVIYPSIFSMNSIKFRTMELVLVYIYIAMMLLLLIISTSLAITIPTCKKILELKYQATSKTTLNDTHRQHRGMSTVEKLREHVRRYWVMAKTSSPQFVMASNPLSTACGVICVISLIIYIPVILLFFFQFYHKLIAYGSNTRLTLCSSVYKWSNVVIYTTQSIGVVVGSIAPIFRCFTVLNFKMFTKWNMNHLGFFKLEEYWTHEMYDWKERKIPFLSSGRRSRTLVQNLKNLVLSFCIGFQKVIVVSCKMIRVISIAVVLIFDMYCLYCWKSLKAMFFTPPIASSNDDMDEDLSDYVLQLEDEMELAEKTLKGISMSMNRLIQKAEKEQHNNILKLLENSTGFEGVENFDMDRVQPLLSVELLNSWSLPVVMLTCIAIALPNIRKDIVDRLYRGVSEGLLYTRLVVESLNNATEYVNIQRATMTLWHEVEDNCKWLENSLEKRDYKGKTSTEILKWFGDKAEEIVTDFNKSTNGELAENVPNKLIVANSMYRIARTILLNQQSNIEPISEEKLFALLSGMIADILVACLTNIPRVITIKCHESVIEKREASVESAANLLGRTTKIIKRLEACELPSLDPDKMAFIDEWRLHLKQSIP